VEGEDIEDDNEDGELEETQQVYTLKMGKKKVSVGSVQRKSKRVGAQRDGGVTTV